VYPEFDQLACDGKPPYSGGCFFRPKPHKLGNDGKILGLCSARYAGIGRFRKVQVDFPGYSIAESDATHG
jgi:hypothetical protein